MSKVFDAYMIPLIRGENDLTPEDRYYLIRHLSNPELKIEEAFLCKALTNLQFMRIARSFGSASWLHFIMKNALKLDHNQRLQYWEKNKDKIAWDIST